MYMNRITEGVLFMQSQKTRVCRVLICFFYVSSLLGSKIYLTSGKQNHKPQTPSCNNLLNKYIFKEVKPLNFKGVLPFFTTEVLTAS